MYGFNIDNTLADTNFNNIFSREQLLGRYKDAPVLYTPTKPFIAITARGTDADVKQITNRWIDMNFTNCEGVYFVDGSEEDKIKGKADVVKRLNLEGYVDSKISTLALFIKYKVTGIKLYHLIQSTKQIKLFKEL